MDNDLKEALRRQTKAIQDHVEDRIEKATDKVIDRMDKQDGVLHERVNDLKEYTMTKIHEVDVDLQVHKQNGARNETETLLKAQQLSDKAVGAHEKAYKHKPRRDLKWWKNRLSIVALVVTILGGISSCHIFG